MLRRGALQGLCVLLVVLAAYGVWVHGLHSEDARGLALVALTVGNLGLVWLNASLGVGWRAVFGKGFRAFWWVVAAAALALAASFALPALRGLLGLSVPSVQGLGLAVLLGVLSVALAALSSQIGRTTPASRQEKTA